MPSGGERKGECPDEFNMLDVSSSTAVHDLSQHSSLGADSGDLSSLCFVPVELNGAGEAVVTISEETSSVSSRSSRPSSAESSSTPLHTSYALSSAHNSSQSHDDEDEDATMLPPQAQDAGMGGGAARKRTGSTRKSVGTEEPSREAPVRITRSTRRVAAGRGNTLQDVPEEVAQPQQKPRTRTRRVQKTTTQAARNQPPGGSARSLGTRTGRRSGAGEQELQEAIKEVREAKERRRTYVIKIAVNIEKPEQPQPQPQVHDQQPPTAIQYQLQPVLEQEQEETRNVAEPAVHPAVMSIPPPSYSMLSVHPGHCEDVQEKLPEKEDLPGKSGQDKKSKGKKKRKEEEKKHNEEDKKRKERKKKMKEKHNKEEKKYNKKESKKSEKMGKQRRSHKKSSSSDDSSSSEDSSSLSESFDEYSPECSCSECDPSDCSTCSCSSCQQHDDSSSCSCSSCS